MMSSFFVCRHLSFLSPMVYLLATGQPSVPDCLLHQSLIYCFLRRSPLRELWIASWAIRLIFTVAPQPCTWQYLQAGFPGLKLVFEDVEAAAILALSILMRAPILLFLARAVGLISGPTFPVILCLITSLANLPTLTTLTSVPPATADGDGIPLKLVP